MILGRVTERIVIVTNSRPGWVEQCIDPWQIVAECLAADAAPAQNTKRESNFVCLGMGTPGLGT